MPTCNRKLENPEIWRGEWAGRIGIEEIKESGDLQPFAQKESCNNIATFSTFGALAFGRLGVVRGTREC